MNLQKAGIALWKSFCFSHYDWLCGRTGPSFFTLRRFVVEREVKSAMRHSVYNMGLEIYRRLIE